MEAIIVIFTMRTLFACVSLIALLGAGCAKEEKTISSFADCAAAGNPIMESYPRQCRAGGKTFVEELPTPVGGGLASIVQLGDAFTLEVGKFRAVQGGLRVTLLEVNDSRCKPGLQCVWAGELAPKLRIEGPEDTAPEQELTLGTARVKKADVSGFHFELKDATESTATIVITR